MGIDNDGWSSESEFFFGLNPTNRVENQDHIPSVGVNRGGESSPTFSYSRQINAPGINDNVQISYDLLTWISCARSDGATLSETYTMAQESGDHGDGRQTVTIRYNRPLAAISDKPLFFRISAEE
ncbi:MAG: hypothetical protein ACJAVK_002381 [Akkermansiaceae bacterium]|jgi:hypothetical protein